MEVREWLKNTEKKDRFLIVRDRRYGRDLLASAGFGVFGTKCMTVSEAARTIVSYELAKEGRSDVRMIRREYASRLLRKVLLEHVKEFSYYTDPELLDQAGADEIERVLSIVIANRCDESRIDDLSTYDHARIADLFRIRRLYEQEMKREGVMDPALVLHEAACRMQEAKEDVLFFGEIAVLSEEAEYFSFDERQMLEGMARLLNEDHRLTVLTLPPHYAKLYEGTVPEEVEMTFARGFGYANEVKHIVYDLLYHNYKYGDTCILYASGAMEPWLVSELEALGVPYAFEDGRSMAGNALVCFFRSLLKWAAGGFRLTDFADVLASRVLNWNYVFDGEEKTWHAERLMYRMARGKVGGKKNYMIGWGYERYRAYAQLYRIYMETEEPDEERKLCGLHAADVLEDLLDLFTTKETSCGIFAQKMLDWIDAHVPSNSMARKEAYTAFADLVNYFRFADLPMGAQQVYAIVDRKLSELRTSQEADGNQVVLKSLGHPGVLRRRHVYVCGMSANNLSANTDESPVLNDHEMSVLLSGGYLPLIAQEGLRRRKEILRTLSSMEKGTMQISWPDYDTQEMNERNPAVLVLDLMHMQKTEESRGFSYGIPERAIALTKKVYDLPVRTPASSLLENAVSFSATSLEKLAECPRAWYYDQICRMGKQDIPEPAGNVWLDSRQKGNFLHEVFEIYAREVFGNRRKEDYPQTVDSDVLKRIVQRVRDSIRNEVPDAEEWLMERETEKLTALARTYLQTVHADYLEQGWEFLFAEVSFENAELEAGMTFATQGRIDRVDCRIVEETKEVRLRTIDYKTGRPDRIEQKKAHGTALQMEVYTSALQQEQLQEQIRKVLEQRYGSSFADYRIVNEIFFYVFPLEEEESRKPVFPADSFGKTRLQVMVDAVRSSGTFPDRFRIGQKLEETSGDQPSPDIAKILDAINGAPKQRGKGRKKTEELCKYCDFAKLCTAALVK